LRAKSDLHVGKTRFAVSYGVISSEKEDLDLGLETAKTKGKSMLLRWLFRSKFGAIEKVKKFTENMDFHYWRLPS